MREARTSLGITSFTYCVDQDRNLCLVINDVYLETEGCKQSMPCQLQRSRFGAGSFYLNEGCPASGKEKQSVWHAIESR